MQKNVWRGFHLADKIYRILSIDGGGIKGLFSATVIESFEKRFQCKISDYFDLICGTSTGGIIAAALAVGIPAKDIVNFYKADGPKIFHYKRTVSRRFAYAKNLFFNSKYDNKILRQSLERVFADKKNEGFISNTLYPFI
jgi:patatin-like phospholipase/acyl hydrolase